MQPKSTDLHFRHRQLGADQALVQEERTLLTLQPLPVYYAVGRIISVELNELKIWFYPWEYRLYYIICRFRMVKKWFPQNTFFSWFFTGRAFIMVYYIIKLVLAFQFDLQNPLKQPIMWIFEKWKIIVFGQNYDIFWPKGGLKPCIIMYLGNIRNMFLVPVTFGNFFFQILQKWHFLS